MGIGPVSRTWAAQTDGFPPRVSLLVAGPVGGKLDVLSRTLAQGLQDHLPGGTTVARRSIGGLDGVTGANEFVSQSSVDGEVALLVPGAASMAWLVGDSRVHFDPLQWAAIFAQTGPATVLGNARSDAVIRKGGVVRVASSGPASPSLAAMLAIDLLGAQVQPVDGLEDDTAALTALQSGKLDVLLTRRSWVVDAQSTLYPTVRPLFSCRARTSAQDAGLDVSSEGVPGLLAYSARLGREIPPGPRFDAWSCAARVAELRYALVLPGLTPPSAVALWREAGAHAMLPNLSAASDLLYASAASVLLRSLSPGAAALLDLRQWLANRLAWHPG